MLGRTIQNQPLLSNDETNALFEVVTDYTYALDTLDNYDYERLTIDKTTTKESFQENEMIWLSRQQLADLFGRDYKTISKLSGKNLPMRW